MVLARALPLLQRSCGVQTRASMPQLRNLANAPDPYLSLYQQQPNPQHQPPSASNGGSSKAPQPAQQTQYSTEQAPPQFGSGIGYPYGSPSAYDGSIHAQSGGGNSGFEFGSQTPPAPPSGSYSFGSAGGPYGAPEGMYFGPAPTVAFPGYGPPHGSAGDGCSAAAPFASAYSPAPHFSGSHFSPVFYGGAGVHPAGGSVASAYYPPNSVSSPPLPGNYAHPPGATNPGSGSLPSAPGTVPWGSSSAWSSSDEGFSSGGDNSPAAPPLMSARERQRQFLSLSLVKELDALESRQSAAAFLEGIASPRLGGRMGCKEWLYATNVLGELLVREDANIADLPVLIHQQLVMLTELRRMLRAGKSNLLPHDAALLAANAARVQGLFSIKFLSKDALPKAARVLADPSLELQTALQNAASSGASSSSLLFTEGEVASLTPSAYRSLCDSLVSEVVFLCAKKIESHPASTQPSHVRALATVMRAAPAQLLPREVSAQQMYCAKTVKTVWTELLLRICPLLGRYEIPQLLRILQGASALANRQVVRDNDLLTLTQAAGALLEQERFAAEVKEGQRCRLLFEFFKWALDTNAPFTFVRHVAWKATRLFKLNVRWFSSNEAARLLPVICANRVLLSEDELVFFASVFLKRVSRATPLYAEAQKLSADAAAAVLFGVALFQMLIDEYGLIGGLSVKHICGRSSFSEQFAGLLNHLLHEAPSLQDIPPAQSLVFARLAWALCATRAFDPKVAEGSWSAEDAASLLETALRRFDLTSAPSLAMLTLTRSEDFADVLLESIMECQYAQEILTEIEYSRDLLPALEVPAVAIEIIQGNLQAALSEAQSVQIAADQRQARRLQFTLRRALEKLGAEVRPSRSSNFVSAVGTPGVQGEDGNQQEVPFGREAIADEERSVKDDDALFQEAGSAEKQAHLAGDLWIFNHQLGPYNVSFFCPSKNIALEIDDRCLSRLRVIVVGEHLFQLSRTTGERGVDLLRAAIASPEEAEEICPPRHVQLQALLRRVARQKPKAGESASPLPDV